MTSKGIDDVVIFKRNLDLPFLVDQKKVSLRMGENKLLRFNFTIDYDEKNEFIEYFQKFKREEYLLVDIGNTGFIKCIFKGISPVLINPKENGEKGFNFTVILQEFKRYSPEDDEPCESCEHCGLH